MIARRTFLGRAAALVGALAYPALVKPAPALSAPVDRRIAPGPDPLLVEIRCRANGPRPGFVAARVNGRLVGRTPTIRYTDTDRRRYGSPESVYLIRPGVPIGPDDHLHFDTTGDCVGGWTILTPEGHHVWIGYG